MSLITQDTWKPNYEMGKVLLVRLLRLQSKEAV